MARIRKLIVGIDEAGRGPLAGPVAVGAVSSFKFQDLRTLKNIKDSKKLSAKKREEWERKIKSQKSNLKSAVIFVSHKFIDKHGISRALNIGVEKVLNKISEPIGLVLLDGALKAPKHYKQKTIIKGDEKIPLISAASIIAKTARDKKMLHFHKKFPQYCFDRHKGYGTKLHYKKLKKHGLCEIHRKSYLKNFR